MILPAPRFASRFEALRCAADARVIGGKLRRSAVPASGCAVLARRAYILAALRVARAAPAPRLPG